MYPNPYAQYLGPQAAMNPYQGMIGGAPQMQVTKVNGEGGANAFSMGPNSSAILLDESGLMIWLVTSDGAGYKTVQAYDIAPHKAEQAPDFGGLEDRIRRLEERVNGITGNTSTAEQKQHVTNGTAHQADDDRGTFRTEPSAGVKPAYYAEPADEAGYGHRSEARRRSDGGLQG